MGIARKSLQASTKSLRNLKQNINAHVRSFAKSEVNPKVALQLSPEVTDEDVPACQMHLRSLLNPHVPGVDVRWTFQGRIRLFPAQLDQLRSSKRLLDHRGFQTFACDKDLRHVFLHA